MKHVQKFAFAMLALVAIGCGGSGSGTPSTSISGTTSKYYVEAIVKILPTNLIGDKTWTTAQLLNPQTPGLQADLVNPTVFGVVDPMNIQTGEEVVFQLVTYPTDSNGNPILNAAGLPVRNILPATFSSSDISGAYGVLAGGTGDYVAGSAKSSGNLAITATYQGAHFQTNYSIQVEQARILGTVLGEGLSSTSGAQLYHTKIQFYDGNGSLVDTVTVQYDGSFRASVPTTAQTFTVVPDSIPASFYQSYSYSYNVGGTVTSYQYDAGVIGCDGQALLFPPSSFSLPVGTTTLPQTIYVQPRSSGAILSSTGCQEP
jgi:hypothetical protein